MGETFFTFAEFHSRDDLNLLIKDVQRNAVGELSPQTTTIPGKMGEIYEGTRIGAKQIIVDAIIKATNETERIERIREIGQLVEATLDGDLFPLKFSDEIGITYWGYIAAVTTPTRVLERGADSEISLTFSIAEGVGYGERIGRIITTPTFEMIPIGTAPTYPILTLSVGTPLKQAGVATETEFVYVGSGVEDEANTATTKLVLNDNCSTMSTWTKMTSPTYNLENGVTSSDVSMTSTGKAIQASKQNNRFYYGPSTNKTKWKGPTYQQLLPQLLEDWKITVRFYVDNRYARSRSKIELYLLNSAGSRIGRFMIKDNSFDKQNEVLIEVGPNNNNKNVFYSVRDSNKITVKGRPSKKTITISAKRKTTDKKKGYKKGDTYSQKLTVESNDTENKWTDFYGNLTLQKKGNKYTATVQKLNKKGVATGSPIKKTFTDTTNTFTTMMENFAGVAVYAAAMPIEEDLSTTAATYNQNIVQLCDVRVWNLKQSGTEPDETFEAGDEIIFDLDNAQVYKNGEKIPFAIGSQFFSVRPNQATNIGLLPEPDSNNTWTLEYFPRYL